MPQSLEAQQTHLDNVLGVLEGRTYRGAARPLSENHWSNILAWLVDPSCGEPAVGAGVTQELLHLAGIVPREQSVTKVERERRVQVREAARAIDLVLTFEHGWELLVENKIDRTYEDVVQLRDELAALRTQDHMVLLCPRGKTLLRGETRQLIDSDPRLHHVRWLELAEACASLLARVDPMTLDYHLLHAITAYWPSREMEDFAWQVETIVEERGWTRFYPDEFKEAFCSRFGEVYREWVGRHGERGNGGAHQRLTQRLVGQTRKSKGGFRLETTGNQRPAPEGWGYGFILEYRVLLG